MNRERDTHIDRRKISRGKKEMWEGPGERRRDREVEERGERVRDHTIKDN